MKKTITVIVLVAAFCGAVLAEGTFGDLLQGNNSKQTSISQRYDAKTVATADLYKVLPADTIALVRLNSLNQIKTYVDSILSATSNHTFVTPLRLISYDLILNKFLQLLL